MFSLRNRDEIFLPKLDSNVFQELLKFIYTGEPVVTTACGKFNATNHNFELLLKTVVKFQKHHQKAAFKCLNLMYQTLLRVAGSPSSNPLKLPYEIQILPKPRIIIGLHIFRTFLVFLRSSRAVSNLPWEPPPRDANSTNRNPKFGSTSQNHLFENSVFLL